MARKAVDVTETELGILDALWKRGPITVREIVELLYGQHTSSLHATVKSLLDRLAEKGLVTSDNKRFAHTFSATIGREEFVGQQLKALAESHFGGSLAPMLLALVESASLNRKDYASIRRIIKKLDRVEEDG